MKIRHIACLSIAFLIPQLSHATLPVTPDTLGQQEGILDACANADPINAAQYQARKAILTGGASNNQVSQARDTQQYQAAKTSTHNQLAKVPASNVVSACTAFLQGK
jgi:hypothetical protein